MSKKRVVLVLRVVVAIILIQTLRFKFTAHPDSVYIFEALGLEPHGRITIGILELIAGILILIPRTAWLGAALTMGIIGGAIVSHLTQLGIVVNNDNGVLFITAVVTFILAAIILIYYRKSIPLIGKKL
ncbi:MAG: DoxX family protein [Bacteroidia bacterium]|nr:DoxX family protein [Bacteroidia bacterium]MBT8268533.1 DoxX family protein [Bacteroidia bacterium]NNF83318.1 DoxX family membrane protein [Flavobacteriaceae bacterium]NNK71192.1 DoxX family membrane protein [Flavobacteriaceae bacterium]NNL81001.1 DoxX family membrane protein [Flavobacteriaceae bacterium]